MGTTPGDCILLEFSLLGGGNKREAKMKISPVSKAAYFNLTSLDLGNTLAAVLGGGGKVAAVPPAQAQERHARRASLKKVFIYLMQALLSLYCLPINPSRGAKPRAAQKAADIASAWLSLPNTLVTSSAKDGELTAA